LHAEKLDEEARQGTQRVIEEAEQMKEIMENKNLQNYCKVMRVSILPGVCDGSPNLDVEQNLVQASLPRGSSCKCRASRYGSRSRKHELCREPHQAVDLL
jgi:hypothetical protein